MSSCCSASVCVKGQHLLGYNFTLILWKMKALVFIAYLNSREKDTTYSENCCFSECSVLDTVTSTLQVERSALSDLSWTSMLKPVSAWKSHILGTDSQFQANQDSAYQNCTEGHWSVFGNCYSKQNNIQDETNIAVSQRFWTDVLWHTDVSQEFLKHSVPDYLVRDTDLFSFSLSNEKMTTANATIAAWCESIKIVPIISFSLAKIIHFLVCCRILVTSLCVPRDEKGWKSQL